MLIIASTSVGLSSGDFKAPITGGHYCSITLTLIVPPRGHWIIIFLATRAGRGCGGKEWQVARVREEQQPPAGESSPPCTSRVSGEVMSEGCT